MLAALLALAFAPALFALARVWAAVDYQSHGFLVPVVALWVAQRERPRRRGLAIEPDRRGLAVLVVALAAYLFGAGAGLVSLQGLALVIAVAGGVLLTRGAAWLRALAFPIAFLIFMVPVPPAWIGPTIVRLQVLVSSASVALLELFGLGITRSGNVLRLPNGDSLFVAEACSGVTSIVTLTPLAVLLGYFTLRRFGTRALLVVAVVPLAMVGNLARVVTTCALAARVGAERATSGWFHESAGLLTYAVACGLMLAVGAGLRRLEEAGGWTRSA
jgi:exosortase